MNYRHRRNQEEDRLEEKIIATQRVAKVVKGGRNFSFSAIVVVGDKAGKVGVGKGKANEIVDAIRKAKERAVDNMFRVSIVRGTVPHEVMARYGAARVMIKPASPGTGIIAGSTARAIFEAAGIENILCKSIGSNTPINVVKATISGLKSMRTISDVARLRNKSIAELTGQPEPTARPEPVAQPEPTARPEPVAQPELAIQTEPTGQEEK